MVDQTPIEISQQFEKLLNIAREKLDLSTSVGRTIDLFITPLFKRHGYLDLRTQAVHINLENINPHDTDLLNQDPDQILKFFGVDKVDIITADRANPKISDTYLRIKDEIKKFSNLFLGKSSFNVRPEAWHTYSMLSHITDLSKMINAVIQTKTNETVEKHKEIAESLQKVLYYKHKDVNQSIKKIAESFNISSEDVIVAFTSHLSASPIEYSKTLINEALGPLSSIGAIGQKALAKMAPGQTSIVAQAKLDATRDSDKLLKNWSQTTLGKVDAATPTALTSYVVNFLHLPKPLADKVVRKYKPSFLRTATTSYLPKKFLRNFMFDVIYAQKTLALTPEKPVISPAARTTAPKARVTPATAPTTATTGTPSTAAPNAGTQPTAPTSNQRLQSALSAIAELSPEEARKALDALLAKRK